jgi:hypothetical protein
MQLLSIMPCRLQGVRGLSHPLKTVPMAELLGAGTLAVGLLRYMFPALRRCLQLARTPYRELTCCAFMLSCSFILGLWPVFGFLSPLMVVVTLYGGVMSLNFVPGFGLLRPAGELGSGIRKQPSASSVSS